jgi:hypothetical protein
MKIYKRNGFPVRPNRELNLFECATILFKVDSGENPHSVCKEYNLTPKKLKELRLLKLSYPPLANAYREAVQGYRDEWITDAADFLKNALRKATELIGQCEDPSQLGNLIRSIETVGELIIDQKVVDTTSYSLLQNSLPKSQETVDTEFTEILSAPNSQISKAMLKEYNLTHLASDYETGD